MHRATRLPPPSDLSARLLASPVGSLVTRPWFDRLALHLGLAAYLPLSRAWSAASVADGSVERFLVEVPLDRLPAGVAGGFGRTLRRIAELSGAHDRAERAWEAGFFGSVPADAGALVAAEVARRRASDRFMKGRLAFLPLRVQADLPSVRFEIPNENTVEARYGAALARIEAAYLPADPLPTVTESRRVEGQFGTEYWLRFPSGDPVVGRTAWAHVFEPAGVSDPPSLVYGHGLAIELESMDGIAEGSIDIVGQGVRFVRLEAPWHNRRRIPGSYGGEPFLATPPLGALDLFAAQVREMATLIAWCRRSGTGRVAVGGTSLGALVSQLVATHSRHWPAPCRPDAVFLATTTEDVGSLSHDSSIARLVGLPGAVAAAGWTRRRLDRWRPLTDPLGDPPLDPRDIVMVLGRVDDVTPFARGMALARRWRIPEGNLFLRDAGHFSAALDLSRDRAPLRRLAERLYAG